MKNLCFLFVVAATVSSTNVRAQQASVSVTTQVECRVKGISFNKQSFTAEIPIQIYSNADGTDFWGVGSVAYNYPHPVYTRLSLFNPQKLTTHLNFKYAFNFTTVIEVAPGVSMGGESSILYTDSLAIFSPLYQAVNINFGNGNQDYCWTETLVSPLPPKP